MTEPPQPAEIVETHISVIALIGDRAYKLLKPVETGFLDHRTREDRLEACRRETEINRRFAPDVYLGVLDVIDEDGQPRDHLVSMRRLPATRRLSALLGTAEAPDLIREVARAVSGFHRDAPTSPRIARAGEPAAVLGLWEEGLDQLGSDAPGVVAAEDIEEARALARAYLRGREALLARRIADGRVRDGHGDLLSDDVYCMPDGPRVLDCLAFDERYRHGDVLGDVAFLAMDLEAHGRPGLGALLVAEWCAALGEDHPVSLAHHYVAYRAHVRSKVAALRAGQGGDPDAASRARALHVMCLDHLRRAQVRMVLVGGAPGVGKSTVARDLGESLSWAVIGSDAVRKDLAGLPPTPGDPGAFEAGLYAPEMTDRVYARMLHDAASRIAMGESVILDASWTSEARREAARRLASEAGASLTEIRCDLPPEVAAARIVTRREAGEGPSDATPAIAARLAAAADPWPQAAALGTGAPRDLVLAEARRLVGDTPWRIGPQGTSAVG
jgi:aminoglycoside phosphotransferase family enzyme/predicted kinase